MLLRTLVRASTLIVVLAAVPGIFASKEDELVEVTWEVPGRRLGQSPDEEVPEQLDAHFQLDGSRVQVSLLRNRALLTSNTRHVLHHADGRLEDGPMPEPCFYIGEVQSLTGSGRASFSTCQGGFTGLVLLEGHALLLEPRAGIGRALRDQGRTVHWVRRLQEEQLLEMFEDVQSFLAPNSSQSRRLTESSTKYVEVVVVNDNSRYNAFGGLAGLSSLAAHSVSVMNTLTSIYRRAPSSGTFPYTIQVVLVAQHTFLQQDPWETTVSMSGSETQVNSLLGLFLHWSKNEMLAGTLAPNDNRILLSGRNFDGSTVGYAGVSAVCDIGRSGSINMCGSSNAGLGRCSATVAHEMGHNFGMLHDGSGGNGCATSGNIMEAVGGGPTPDTFSGCSVAYITAFFNDVYRRQQCLENKPTQVYGDPVCQNGFVEQGEDCDCGAADCSSLDPCCNGATCTYADPSYECSDTSQLCCQNCRNISASANHVCRAARNSCDLSEVCPGGTAECPDDVYAYPGQPCNASAGACFEYTTALDCPSTRCTWTAGACQQSSDPWEGPLSSDIPGLGFGKSSAPSLVACKQTCIDAPSCQAIQFSASETYEGNNCFIFSNQADTGAQYQTFQVFKLHRIQEYAGSCALGSCKSMDYTCSVDVNRDFAGSWDLTEPCAQFNDECKMMICHQGEHSTDANKCGQNFVVHSQQMTVPEGTPCWHPSTPKGTRTGLCMLGSCTLPHSLAEVPKCGNGGIDHGEQCDCGSQADPCCNCETCQLQSGNQCSSHEDCCDASTCKFKANGTTCRAAASSCDVVEVCSGTSGCCPSDVGRRWGASCVGNDGQGSTCYAKQCVTSLNAQCKSITGGARPVAKIAIEGGIHNEHQCTALNCCTSCGVIQGNVIINGVRYSSPTLCNSCERLSSWSTFTVVSSDGSTTSNTIYLGAAEDGTVLLDSNSMCITAAAYVGATSCSSPNADSDGWEGPLSSDIPGVGFGQSSAASLAACQKLCSDDSSCRAISYSATDNHEGNNCFRYKNQADTGAQYLTFQVFKFYSKSQFLEESTGRCLPCDAACSKCTGPSPFDCTGSCVFGAKDFRGACPISAEQAALSSTSAPTPRPTTPPMPFPTPSPPLSPSLSPSPSPSSSPSPSPSPLPSPSPSPLPSPSPSPSPPASPSPSPMASPSPLPSPSPSPLTSPSLSPSPTPSPVPLRVPTPSQATTFDAVLEVENATLFDLEKYRQAVEKVSGSSVTVENVEFKVDVSYMLSSAVTATEAKSAIATAHGVREDRVEVTLNRRLAAPERSLASTQVRAVIKATDVSEINSISLTAADPTRLATVLASQGKTVNISVLSPPKHMITVVTTVSTNDAPSQASLASRITQDLGMTVTATVQPRSPTPAPTPMPQSFGPRATADGSDLGQHTFVFGSLACVCAFLAA